MLVSSRGIPGIISLIKCISDLFKISRQLSFLIDLHPAASTCFSVTTELVMAQKALVACAEGLLEVSRETMRRRSGFFRSTGFLPYLKSRLSVSAGRVLRHEWEDDGQGKSLKSKVS